MGFFGAIKAEQWIGKGDDLYGLQRYDEALEAYDQAIEIDPDDAEKWICRGNALTGLELYEEALESYRRATGIDPDNATAWQNVGITLYELKQYQDALEAYDNAIERDPDDPDLWNNVGLAYFELQQFDEALKAYDLAIDFDPDNVSAWCLKGAVLLELQRLDEALEVSEHVIYHDYMAGWCLKGGALFELRRFDEALEVSEYAIEIDPDNLAGWCLKGAALGGLQRYDEALVFFDRAIRIDSNDKDVWNAKGEVLFELHQYDEALVAYDRAIAINSNFPDPWCNKGKVLVALQRYKEAKTCCNKALELDPDDSSAQELGATISNKLSGGNTSERSVPHTKETPHCGGVGSLLIERTIFDPVTTGFLLSSKRNLPNVQQWILSHDPSSYWYVICLKNTLIHPVDEWGISLEMGKAAGISEIVIENRDVYVAVDEYIDREKPWVKSFHFGFSRHDGVVIPRDGSLRLYIKIYSKACNTDVRIAGKFIADGFESIEIPEKRFTFACDVENYKTALATNPENAKHLTENVLKRSFDPDTTRVLLQAFGHIHDINQCCSQRKYDLMLDKMHTLDDLFDKASAPERVHKMLSNNIRAVEMLDDGEETYERVERLWSSMLDVWQNEYITK